MSAKDISRFLFQPEKRYAGVRMQQGRIMLDSDWNESARIDDEEARRRTVETICAKGTSNQGFLVGRVKDASYDFPLASGSYYLGGLRFEVVPGIEERFLSQTDWLQMQIDPTAANLPVRPSVEDLTDENGNFTTRHDLVYLRAWEQCVTAVEDSELRERALGGPDTSVRIRRMRRIEVLSDVPSTCPEAFALLKQQLTAGAVEGSSHIFDEANCELKTGARLTVSFDSEGITEDPCKPKIAGGFLGAENQTIRVQLTAPDRFVWGYNNASPLYRVQVEEGDGAVKIKFLTLPRDQAAQPLAGQAVEILPWGAILPNQEKVAELQGHLTTVATSFNPEDSTLTITTPVPQAWIDWLSTAEDKQKYFYLRLWTGGTGKEDEPDWPFMPGGEAVPLKGTGLKVSFSSPGLPGDHWIIAARPNTPDLVVPWELMTEAPPVGPRFFFAPLAMIRWSVKPPENAEGDAIADASAFDCRDKFRPLCDVRGCCTVTVGDGKQSKGDVNSIQDAVELLPRTGGEICVLDGEHIGNVLIERRRNITIRGCGERSLLKSERVDKTPVITIRNSENITVHSLAFETMAASALTLEFRPEFKYEGIVLENLDIVARDFAAIVATGGDRIVLRNNRILVFALGSSLAENPEIGRQSAVFLAGEHLLIEGNRIIGFGSATQDFPHTALGGLQIGGGSQHVEIRRNLIRGGNGNGITLGSIDLVPIDIDVSFDSMVEFFSTDRPRAAQPSFLRVTDNGCIIVDPVFPLPEDDDVEPLTPISEGRPLTDVLIIDNDISRMGMNGIGVAHFFDLEENPDFITTDRLTIEGNRIRECMQLELAELPRTLRENAGFGGIALADGEYMVIRDNIIENNGTKFIDPICGIFILHGQGIAIDGNRILHNGRLAEPDVRPRPGQRGGIVIGFARSRTQFVDTELFGIVGARQDGVPAARIHDNIVVSPEGRALKLLVIGPVSVEANQFTAQGSHSLNLLPFPDNTLVGARTFSLASAASVPFSARAVATNPLTAFLDVSGGAVVSIVNLGVSNEIYGQLIGLSGLGQTNAFSNVGLRQAGSKLFVGGNILFNDNQVVLDAVSPAITLALSSVLLISLDDVSMSGNQCDCDLVIDFVGMNALVMAPSLRVADNRFKEGFFNAVLSAFTFGLMNATADNQGTHCFLAVGHPNLSVISPNRSFTQHPLFSIPDAPDPCDLFEERRKQITKQLGFPDTEQV